MNKVARRANITLVLVAVLVIGLTFFLAEFISDSEQWVSHEGSPHIYKGEANINCGIITDREGYLLLDMKDGREYSTNSVLRKATLHWLGDHYGNVYAPAPGRYAIELAGYDKFNGVYSYGGTGGEEVLTLSAKVQVAALTAMGDRKGTVAVYNYKTGELICAVSTPTYDPDNVPDIEGDTTGAYEGVYINRFTQSVYIPGSIFKVVTAAAALEEIPDIESQIFTCYGAYEYGVDKVTCEVTHGSLNLKDAFAHSCNCAFAQIANQLGGETLAAYIHQFGLDSKLSFDGITTAAGHFDVAQAEAVEVAWSAIGQHEDQINACTFLTFIGAVANGGEGAKPYLVQEVNADGKVTYKASLETTGAVMSEDTARKLQEYMRNNVQTIYGNGRFPNVQICAKSGTGEVGGEQRPNAAFTGFILDEDYPLAFVVVVEDGGYGSTVCIPIITPILEECIRVLDEE